MMTKDEMRHVLARQLLGPAMGHDTVNNCAAAWARDPYEQWGPGANQDPFESHDTCWFIETMLTPADRDAYWGLRVRWAREQSRFDPERKVLRTMVKDLDRARAYNWHLIHVPAGECARALALVLTTEVADEG